MDAKRMGKESHLLPMRVITIMGLCFALVRADVDWSYLESSNGTTKWPEKFPACGGARQSPIKLPGENVLKSASLLPVHIFPAEQTLFSKLKFNISLTDHYLKIIIPHETFFFSLMNDIRRQYEVYEIRFHWGSEDNLGSEHWLYGKHYAMETQILGFNRILYPTLKHALNAPNGIAALAFVHEACTDVTPDETLIGVMSGLEHVITNYKNQTGARYLDGFNLDKVLGTLDRGKYFRYEGSLTTPPCTENIIWTVFQETVPILPRQLKVFRELRDVVDEQEYRMANNYRPAVDLNSDDSLVPRKVYMTTNGAPGTRASGSILVTVTFGLLVSLVSNL